METPQFHQSLPVGYLQNLQSTISGIKRFGYALVLTMENQSA